MALRAVTFFRNDGGYIDRYLEAPPSSSATRVQKDINSDQKLGRAPVGALPAHRSLPGDRRASSARRSKSTTRALSSRTSATSAVSS